MVEKIVGPGVLMCPDCRSVLFQTKRKPKREQVSFKAKQPLDRERRYLG